MDNEQQTHYDVLGISQTATSHEIIDAYMRLRNHFEQIGVQEQLEIIREAYTILSNIRTRDRYDDELIRQGRVESPFFDDDDDDHNDDESDSTQVQADSEVTLQMLLSNETAFIDDDDELEVRNYDGELDADIT